ncbi:MAG TPA: hypothetical protein DCM05_05410 [Elusimicrobia bacterium]|nr:MAG: hypothetical protein A3J79_10125 [Elusimicrobia bacterium RIFOXYB2_FULL_62_6]HAH05958.1 hypothetical protein [Elusimicrobiota bacterium]
MDMTGVLVSLLEFALTIVMAVLVVYCTLRALIRTNTDFNEDEALLKGNVAVGILIAALLLGSANIMYRAFEPVTDLLRQYLTLSYAREMGGWRLLLGTVGNLALAFFIVVATMSFSLRLFGRLTRTEHMRAGAELQKGNVAVGILLGSVVVIVSLFVGDGVAAVSKAVLPCPVAGAMQIMR